MTLEQAATPSKSGRLETIKKYYLPSLFWLVGAAVPIIIGARYQLKERASLSWPTVGGRVLVCNVSDLSATLNLHGEHRLSTYILYTYRVADETYTSSTVAFAAAPGSDSSEYQQALAERYPPDKSVTVYYNPHSPSEALLEPGYNEHDIDGSYYFALLLVGVSILHFLGGLSKKRRDERKARVDSLPAELK